MSDGVKIVLLNLSPQTTDHEACRVRSALQVLIGQRSKEINPGKNVNDV